MKRKTIPKKVEKLIFQEANSSCSFCLENDVNTLEIHHIHEVSEGGSSEAENLILVCSNCHSKITHREISQQEVYQKKLKNLTSSNSTTQPQPQRNINIVDSVNNGVVAQSVASVTIKTSKSSVTVPPPAGSIGGDLEKNNYAKYLIDRYHEFKKADMGRAKMNYTIFYGNIKKEFGAKWDHLPLGKFEQLCVYLKMRIDKTILGKSRRAKGQKSYSSFDEVKNKGL